MPFLNNNVASKLSKADKFQVGNSNVDSDRFSDKGIEFPWPNDPSTSWVYYDCQVELVLDSGIVVHNRLPQVDKAPDTLASCDFDDPNIDRRKGGVNLRCNDRYQDIVQRMGHSRYFFRLFGQAIRLGFQIPIPSLKSVGGVPVVPYDKIPQRAYNRMAPGGNYGGVILWIARWSLWYTTAVPPTNNTVPASDPSAHIRGDASQPSGIQVPYSLPDDDAITNVPRTTTNQPNVISQ